MYITPYAFLLVAALCTTTTLAKDGKGDSIPRRRDHGLDVCIHVCNKFADGEMRWKAVCNACINNGDGIATLDFECKNCARACKGKHHSSGMMWYCNTCYEKGVNPADWDGKW